MSASDGRLRGAGSALLGLIAVAVIAGVMVTVGIAPAIALTGVGANNAIALFQNLPSDLKIGALQQKTQIYATSHGKPKLIASFYNQNREVLTWPQLTQNVKNATLAAEDVRFYQHGAVDPAGIVRAIVADVLHKDQGASTISQQYVKNVCVQEAELKGTQAAVTAAYDICTDHSVTRKIKEARLAIGLEKRYSKNDILLGYLNIAGFGTNIYGIETAAEYYYGVHVKDLTIAQAASLIAIVNYPDELRIDVKSHIAANQARRDYVLGQELKYKMITEAQYETAIASPVKPKITASQSGCAQAKAAAYFCDYVVNTVEQSAAFGTTPASRTIALQSAGWKIYTTLNLDLESKASKSMKKYVPAKSPTGDIGGAAVTVQPGTGKILSMVQSKTFDQTSSPDTRGKHYTATSVNYSTDTAYGGSAGFQPGSTFKLFTLVDWLENGHGLNDVVNGNARTIPASDFQHCGSTYVGDPWTFGNDDTSENGYSSVLHGTEESINGVFATMATKLDLCKIRLVAQDLDVHTANRSPIQDYPPFVIGQASTFSPLTMATAYAGIADKGRVCTPVAINKVVKTDGSQLSVPKTSCSQAVPTNVAVAAGYALHAVTQSGTIAGDLSDGKYLMGKTGTTDNAYDTWEVGGSTASTTAIWVGGVRNVTGPSNLRQVLDFPECGLGGGLYRQAAVARHCLWHDIVGASDKIYGGDTSWPTVDPQFMYGAQTAVPNVAGESLIAAKATLTQAGFEPVIGSAIASETAKGLAAGTDPAGGTQASSGSKITIHPSSGPAAVTPTPTPTPGGDTGTVPGVLGRPIDNARSLLTAAGFTNIVVNYNPGGPINSCLVVGENPGGGTTIAKSTQISLAVQGNQGKCQQ